MERSSIRDHYDLLISLLKAERQQSEQEAALRQAKFDLRQAKASQLEYGSTFRSFLDKFTGKREETETALRHAVRKAEADLATAQQEKAALEAQIAALREQLADLPAWESRCDRSAEWYQLEALYCLEVLAPLLEANLNLLTERRNQFNVTCAGQVKTRYALAEIYTAPEAAAEACKPYLLRLKTALSQQEIPFELHRYFEEPTAFLSSATQFTRMDRINTAIAQTEALQKRLPGLKTQLED